MRNEKTKKWFAILLTTVLLLQLSYHTLHVFTQHAVDSHIEHIAHDTQIDKTSLTCELCAKLLGQTLYVWVYPTLLLGLVFSSLFINAGESAFKPRTRTNYLLRGPPTV